MNPNGIFPIQTASACKLKWTWSTIRLYDGTTCSCHRCNHHTFNIDTFDFHNTAAKLAQRTVMLDGDWPKGIGCEFCHDVELAGGTSDRMFQKGITGYPSELDLDKKCIEVTPTTVEVYFDNKCNLACVYCIPAYSSRIQQEIRKFGGFRHGFNRSEYSGYEEIFPVYNKHEEYDYIKRKFWEWMKEHSSNLLRFHILGGEPFYQQDMDKCIDFFNENPNELLEMNIVSNLSIPHSKFCSYIDKLKILVHNKKVKRVDITASIDSWGNGQEYARYGIDLSLFERNMHYMLAQGDWLRINVNQTISNLSIKHMKYLQHKLIEWRKLKKVSQYFGLVVHWDFLHPRVMPWQMWEEDFGEVLDLMGQDLVNADNKEAYKMMKGITMQLRQYSEYEMGKIEQMKLYLDEIDHRRSTNWREVFPYLDI